MKDKKKFPVISIIGRPNVGKSSLFNRFAGKRHAVVEEREGTTRDRIESIVSIKGRPFLLVDTGGFLSRDSESLMDLVRDQIKKAIVSSDILLFVCDGAHGLLPMDIELASLLRKSGKKIILVINKIDNEKREEAVPDFYELGLDEVFPVSCLHNRGIKSLQKRLVRIIPHGSEIEPVSVNPIKVAIVGRPNVGKSSFLNKVLDEERVIVHEEAGTTRDSVDSYFEKEGILYLLIDTAGIRHRRKVKAQVDNYSMMRSKESVDRSEIIFLLIDGLEGFTNDDIRIFEYIRQAGRGCIIAINKWDLVKNIEMSKYLNAILRRMPQARHFPIVFISAKTGRNIQRSFEFVKKLKGNLDLSFSAGALKDFLQEAEPERIPTPGKARAPKFYRMLQTRIFPKEFLVYVNDPGRIIDSHSVYIENRLRERFPLMGVPVKIHYKKAKRRNY